MKRYVHRGAFIPVTIGIKESNEIHECCAKHETTTTYPLVDIFLYCPTAPLPVCPSAPSYGIR